MGRMIPGRGLPSFWVLSAIHMHDAMSRPKKESIYHSTSAIECEVGNSWLRPCIFHKQA